MVDKLIEHWEIIAGAIASVVAFFSGKRKREIEVKKDESNADALHLENINKIFKIQNEQIAEIESQFEKRITSLKKSFEEKITEMEVEISNLQKLVKSKQNVIDEQEKLLEKHLKHIDELKKICRSQSRMINRYKKKYGEIN